VSFQAGSRVCRKAGAVLTLILAVSAAAQTEQFEGQRIVEIRYSPAEQPVDAHDLAALQPLRKGEPLRLSDVALAINRLFSTGRYEDIQVQSEAAPNGVIVRFVTTSATFIGHTTIQGKVATPPSRPQLLNATGLNPGAPFRESDINTATDRMERLLKSNGFLDADVKSELTQVPDGNQTALTFTITTGKRAHYETPVIHGDTRLPEATIVHATGWQIPLIHRWRQVTAARTRDALTNIHRKYQKQQRLMAKVELDKLNDDALRQHVQPVLNIDAGPKVNIKSLEARMSKGKLKKYVPVWEEGSLDNDLLVEGARNLRDYLQSQGYYDVDVDFRRLPQRDDTVEVDYVIARGARYRLVKVEIVGNTYFTTAEIRQRLFMQPASFRLRRGRYSEAFRAKDEEIIANMYKSNGFRDVKVSSAVRRDYNGKPGDMAVTLNIAQGPQYLVDHVYLAGVTTKNADELRASLASSDGQPWADINVAVDRNYILTHYASAGFRKAQFGYTATPTGHPHHVNLTYSVTEGTREYVRNILFTGLETVRWGVVSPLLKIQQGEPLSTETMTNVQKQLYNLDIFETVDTSVQNSDGDEAYKYVLFDVQEANRYRMAVGVGAQLAEFGPTTNNLLNPGGATGFSPDFSLDLTRVNFLGLGHEITLRGIYSTLEERASFDYIVPRFRNLDGRNLTFDVLYDDSRDIRTFSSVREQASVQISQRFRKSLNGYLRFSYSRDTVSNIVIPSLLIPQLLAPERIGTVSFNLIQDRRDNPADPHRGMYNTADVGLAAWFFGSQRDFGRALLRNATYYPIGRTWVLARQTQFGIIAPFRTPDGILPADSIPLPERFFGGGADTDRGFAFDQAGPRDIGAGPTGAIVSRPTGFPLGGNALFFNNVELRFPFIGDNIQGVLFEDMGNIFASLSDMSFRQAQRNPQDFAYMVNAVGFGVRYKTPVGPLRLDLAYSVNPPTYYGFNGTVQQLLACNPNLPPPELPPQCQPVKQNLAVRGGTAFSECRGRDSSETKKMT
jgi:outer membrane protein assembly complex protein YaeT